MTSGAPPSISHLNSPTAHYTETDGGVVDARLYNSPVGLSPDPSTDTWHYRATSLTPSSGVPNTVSLGGMPFAAAISQNSPTADLVAEDGTHLHVAVRLTAPASGTAAPSILAGLASTSAVTYTTSLSGAPSGAVVLRPTISDLDARVVVPSAAAELPETLALTTVITQQVSIVQGADGAVVVSHPQQVCGSQGCQTITAPAFYIDPPVLADAGGAPTSAGPAPVTMQVAPSTGAASITLTPNPAWLAQAGRRFPITLTIPIVTADARAQSGVFATVSDCAPTSSVPLDRVVVGTAGTCQYHAALYFDVRHLWYLEGFSIQSATLHLYTPEVSGPTGVAVYPNAPGALAPAPPPAAPHPTSFPAPHPTAPQTPVHLPATPLIQQHPQLTWDTAPAAQTGAAPLAATGDDGHWHSWDVTAQVQQWVAHVQTNTGLTLESGLTPVAFASLLDGGDGDPATAPYLEVMLQKPQATTTSGGIGAATSNAGLCYSTCTYSDESIFPYGVNGEDVPGVQIGQSDARTSALAQLANSSLYAEFYRFKAEIITGENARGYPIYSNIMPCGDQYYTTTAWSGAYQQMEQAYAAHLIPVVVFLQNQHCVDSNGNETTDWNLGLQFFSYYMPNFGTICIGVGYATTCSNNPPMYLEIGNEVDSPSTSNYAEYWTTLYPNDFENAAQGAYLWLDYPYNGGDHPAYTNFHIITDGIDAPDDGVCGLTNIVDAGNALYNAAYYGSIPVPQQFLGTAVHPYGYMTNEQESGYWKNYGQFSVNTGCTNIDYLILDWRAEMNAVLNTQSQSPLLISETNFASSGVCQPAPYVIEHEGPYQIDLFTWLYDRLGYGGAANYPVRTIWFQEADDLSAGPGCAYPPDPGLYGSGTIIIPQQPVEKPFYSPYLLAYGDYYYFSCPLIYGDTTTWSANLSSLYFYTALGPCY